MTAAWVGWNGKLLEAQEAVISVYDHGFLYGLGLFETFRTYGGKPYLLERHMQRLMGGCAELGIRFDMSAELVAEWTRELQKANGLHDGYVRLTVSAGEGALGLPTGDYVRPNALLLVKELPPANDEALLRGRELRLLRTRRNTPEGTVRFKSLHYMNSILAKRELTPPPSPGAEGLQLTQEGWLAEGIVSNLFMVKEGVICTPSIDTGILPGVTRERVLELAAGAGYQVQEGFYRWEELLQAEEVWMTNSIQELVPITTLSDSSGACRAVGAGQAGPIVRQLLALYREDTLG
ncbi:aminotransferase class IV [Paenibacillus sp. PL2-23]|uniref:aminotransferase class IV n=1 Tax=Paenibacillus sp. PL2-23 TaxID=2100729 RepID=UPI0030F6E256